MLFEYGIRRPLLKKEFEDIEPWVLKLTATASIMVWFAVYWFFQIQAVRELFEFIRVNNF